MEWQQLDAKSQFSKLVQMARHEGPQEIAVRGGRAAEVRSSVDDDALRAAGRRVAQICRSCRRYLSMLTLGEITLGRLDHGFGPPASASLWSRLAVRRMPKMIKRDGIVTLLSADDLGRSPYPFDFIK